MANRNFEGSRLYTGHAMPVQLDCQFTVGSTGAVTSSTLYGPYISSITRLGVGCYQIKMNDNYSKFYDFGYSIQAPVTGSSLNISDGLTSGQAYQIVTVGTSTQDDWEAIGLPTGVTAAAGVGFVASTSDAGTGTGTVKAIAQSGITEIELVGNPNLSLAPSPKGAVFILQCYGTTITGTNSTSAVTGTAAAQTWTVDTVTVTGTNDGSSPPLWTQTSGTATGTNASSALTATAAAQTFTGTVTKSATDPTSGSIMHLRFLLSNSSVIVGGSSTVAAY